MMAKSSKKSAKPSRSTSKKTATKSTKTVKEKPMPFYKLLTAEGWRRLISKKKGK